MEYWITKRGKVIKVNDRKSHVYVVTKYCYLELCRKLEKVTGKYAPFATSCRELINGFFDHRDGLDTISMRCAIGDGLDGWVESGMLDEEDAENIHNLLSRITGCSDDLLSIVFGSYEDPREYGINTLGWTRVCFGVVTVPSLTQRVCDYLLKLYDNMTHGKIAIQVGFKGIYYKDVPKSALLDYRIIESHAF